jgi:hypothetical protein
MQTAFPLPLGLVAVVATVGAVFATILPTCVYLYVEPRCRRHWAAASGEPTSAGRKAPGLVRLTAWLSFAIGQLAIPWLFVPAACAVLLYLQAKLPVAQPLGLGATVSVGVAGLVQSLLAVGLLPLGVRLLARDAKLVAAAATRARRSAMVSAGLLVGGLVLSWAMTAMPSLVHPWLRVALAWAALRPVIVYAAACLLHAMLLGRCARALADGR